MNIIDAAKRIGGNIVDQIQAYPEYRAMKKSGKNPYIKNYLPDKSQKQQKQEQVPMPPVRRAQSQTRRSSPSPTPTRSASPSPSPLPSPAPTQGLAQGPPQSRGRQLQVPKQYADIIRRASEKYGVPSFFLASVLQAESGWRPDVISGRTNSRTGAQGIAQFMPGTTQDLIRRGFGEFDPLNPEEAIMASAFYLSDLKKEVGAPSWFHTAAAYHAGPGNYKKYGGMVPSEKTRNYVQKLMDYTNSVDVKDENWLDKHTIEE